MMLEDHPHETPKETENHARRQTVTEPSNIVNLADIAARRAAAAAEADAEILAPDFLRAMPYRVVLDWAGGDFDRLVAVAQAPDYRPEWIAHQMDDAGTLLNSHQLPILGKMITEAGPFLSKRERWVMRQLRGGPMPGAELVKLAADAVEYREHKRLDICIARDVAKLVERGMVQVRDGLVSA
jgi:hypothetical protein